MKIYYLVNHFGERSSLFYKSKNKLIKDITTAVSIAKDRTTEYFKDDNSGNEGLILTDTSDPSNKEIYYILEGELVIDEE